MHSINTSHHLHHYAEVVPKKWNEIISKIHERAIISEKGNILQEIRIDLENYWLKFKKKSTNNLVLLLDIKHEQLKKLNISIFCKNFFWVKTKIKKD